MTHEGAPNIDWAEVNSFDLWIRNNGNALRSWVFHTREKHPSAKKVPALTLITELYKRTNGRPVEPVQLQLPEAR